VIEYLHPSRASFSNLKGREKMAIVYKVRQGHGSKMLHNGDSMTQTEFHRIYSQMPEGFRAELLGGVVFVGEAPGLIHSDSDMCFGWLLKTYQVATPGVQCLHNVSVMLGKKDEVQPDVLLRILPEFDGTSNNTPDGMYVQGPPELIVEIADSSQSIDLHTKKRRYEKAGVQEYMVVIPRFNDIRWFDLENSRELNANPDGIFESRIFAGLCIDARALLQSDYERAKQVLNLGLESEEHASFVAKLAERKSQ
jgi:Uma2 family endonuclease